MRGRRIAFAYQIRVSWFFINFNSNLFRWLKNLAPIEKNSKIRFKTKDMWSRLIISELDVLDSGFYQCRASNAAGSRNTTSVLRVTYLFQVLKESSPLKIFIRTRRINFYIIFFKFQVRNKLFYSMIQNKKNFE